MVIDANDKLIQGLKCMEHLKSARVEEALRKYKREFFVPKEVRDMAYRDFPLAIGFNQTISQPSAVAIMTEALDIKEGNKVLEIGTGSGWQTSILSYMVGDNGHVYSIEFLEELAESARANLNKVGAKNVEVFVGDGSTGMIAKSPFDRIIVTAACPEIPKPLLEQLKEGGTMVLPVGNLYIQDVLVVKKVKGKILNKSVGSFTFVPLIGKFGFK